MLTVSIIIVTVIAIYYYLNTCLNYWTIRGVPQKTSWGKFVDNLKPILRWNQTVTGMLEYFYKQFPNEKYFGFYQFNKPILLLKDPNLIKEILVKELKTFPDHTSFENQEDDYSMWTTSLFALTGEKWKKMRKIQNAIFTTNKLKNMLPLIEQSTKDFVESLNNKKKINCLETMRHYSIDVIASSVFGIRLNSMKNKNNEMYLKMKVASNFNDFWISLKFFIFFTLPQIFKRFNIKIFDDETSIYFKNLLDEVMIKRNVNCTNNEGDLLNLLIKIQNKQTTDYNENFGLITNKEINNSVLGMIMAGVNSLSNLLIFLFYELAINRHVQDKLREEIRNYSEINYENLSQMKYLEMVLLETFRKWPIGITTNRVSIKSHEIPPISSHQRNSIELPPNTVVWIPIFALHRDPQYFPQPDKFNPERFNELNKRYINPYVYLPFGAGPRSCIGMRYTKLAVKMLVCYVLKEYEIREISGVTQVPIATSWSAFTLSPGGNVWLELMKL